MPEVWSLVRGSSRLPYKGWKAQGIRSPSSPMWCFKCHIEDQHQRGFGAILDDGHNIAEMILENIETFYGSNINPYRRVEGLQLAIAGSVEKWPMEFIRNESTGLV